MLLKILFRALRITIAVVTVLVLLWWFGMRMPGKNVSKTGPLSPDEVALREELRANVQKLAGEIGERNMWHYAQLNAAADFIEDSFSRAGLQTRRDSYEIRGQPCHNIEAEISAAPQGAASAEATAAKAAVSPGHRSLGEGGSSPRSSSSARITIRCLVRRARTITAAARRQCLPWRSGSPAQNRSTRCASLRS